MSEQRSATHGASPGDQVRSFTDEVFTHLPRVDQRRWAHLYVKGLLEVRGKKTLRALAETSGAPGAERGLRQFVNGSPWDWRPARQALLDLALRGSAVRAWTVGSAVIPKRGVHSVGVHRRFVPAAGRMLNCQLGHGLFLCTDQEAIPVDWILQLDQSWLDDRLRMSRARIPAQYDAPYLWPAHLFDAVSWISDAPGAARTPLVADLRRAADVAPFVRTLAGHGLELAVRVNPDQPVVRPGSAGPAGRPGRLSAPVPVPVRGIHTLSRGQRATVTTVGAGDRIQFTATTSWLVQLAAPPRDEGRAAAEPVYRLLAADRPTAGGRARRDYWLTSLTSSPAADVLALTRHTARSETAARSLAAGFGMNDFEGRSFPGWHHHMTLVSAAYAYTRLFPPAEAAGTNRGDLSKFALPDPASANHNDSVELFETTEALSR